MKTMLLGLFLAFGLGVSGAMADASRNFLPIRDAGITTLGEHTNRGGDSQISFCNGTDTSGEFGIFDFDRAAIRDYITSCLGDLTLQQAIYAGRIQVTFSLVASGSVDPNAQVGLMSVYTDDNWVEGTGAAGLGRTGAYNWPGASTGTPACTDASPNDYVGQGNNWHNSATNTAGQQLQNIAGMVDSTSMADWDLGTRNSLTLDDSLWCAYIFGKDSNDTSISVPVSTMLKTYGLGSGPSPMTCYTKEAGADYAPMLTVQVPGGYLLHDGDANRDWKVDVIDLGVLAKNYDRTGLPTSTTDRWGEGSWQLGDFNNDGNVDVVDLGMLAKNYDWKGYPPVPEPGSATFLLLTGLALLRRLGRK